MQGFVAGYYNFALWATRLAYLNLLWIVFTILGLGVFGITPATVAMFAVVRKWVHKDRDIPIFKTFWEVYKKEFVQANILGMILFLIGYLLVIQFNILFHQESMMYKIAAFSVVALMILYTIILTYVFPVFVHFKLKTFDYLKWPFIIGIVHPILTVVLIVGIAVLVTIVYNTIPALLFFFGGSVLAYLLMLGANETFHKYEADNDDPT